MMGWLLFIGFVLAILVGHPVLATILGMSWLFYVIVIAVIDIDREWRAQQLYWLEQCHKHDPDNNR